VHRATAFAASAMYALPGLDLGSRAHEWTWRNGVGGLRRRSTEARLQSCQSRLSAQPLNSAPPASQAAGQGHTRWPFFSSRRATAPPCLPVCTGTKNVSMFRHSDTSLCGRGIVFQESLGSEAAQTQIPLLAFRRMESYLTGISDLVL